MYCPKQCAQIECITCARRSANSDRHYNRVWSKPDLLLFPVGSGHNRRRSGENFPGSHQKRVRDRVRRTRSTAPKFPSHARTHQRRTELFRLKVRSSVDVPCFRRCERKRRTQLPIETYPPFPRRGTREREGEFVRKLVLALVKRNSICVRYFASPRDFLFLSRLEEIKCKFRMRIYGHVL